MVRSLVGKHPSYYEGILQLRDVSQEVVAIAIQAFAQKKIPVPKIDYLRTGADLYIADQASLRAVARQLLEQFSGFCVTTSSLFGRKSGKEIYRITVLFRGIPFTKNNHVLYQDETYQVKSLQKDIFLQHITTGKKIHVPFTQLTKIQCVPSS